MTVVYPEKFELLWLSDSLCEYSVRLTTTIMASDDWKFVTGLAFGKVSRVEPSSPSLLALRLN